MPISQQKIIRHPGKQKSDSYTGKNKQTNNLKVTVPEQMQTKDLDRL